MNNEGERRAPQETPQAKKNSAVRNAVLGAFSLLFGHQVLNAPTAEAINSPQKDRVDLEAVAAQRTPEIRIGDKTYQTVFADDLKPIEISKNQAVIVEVEENGSVSVKLSPDEVVDIYREADCWNVRDGDEVKVVESIYTSDTAGRIPVAITGSGQLITASGAIFRLDQDGSSEAFTGNLVAQNHGVHPRPDNRIDASSIELPEKREDVTHTFGIPTSRDPSE